MPNRSAGRVEQVAKIYIVFGDNNLSSPVGAARARSIRKPRWTTMQVALWKALFAIIGQTVAVAHVRRQPETRGVKLQPTPRGLEASRIGRGSATPRDVAFCSRRAGRPAAV
jgi:hypothetical protein